MLLKLEKNEALILSYFAIALEVFALVVLTFGYAGAIVLLESAAVFMLIGIIVVTSTGLKK